MEEMPALYKTAVQLSAGVKREILSPAKVRLTFAWGFPYEAFNANAMVKPWYILKLIESGRALDFEEPFFLLKHFYKPFFPLKHFYPRYSHFVRSACLTVAKEMYDITVPKTPVTLEEELIFVGKSSINVHTDVLLPSRSLTLATCEAQSILFDMESRRPVPHADWWREKFGRSSDPERQLKVIPQEEPGQDEHSEPNRRDVTGTVSGGKVGQGVPDLPVGDGVRSCDFTVLNSDTDFNGHVNGPEFLRYCLDALVMGVPQGVYQHMEARAVKSAKISFVGEGSAGQRLRVKFWKDRVVPESAHFRIVDLESGQLITYAYIQFYSVAEVEIPVSKL